jgi:hypothetical protein
MRRTLTCLTTLAFALAVPLGAGHAQELRSLSSLMGREPAPLVNVDTIVFKGMTLTAAQKDSIQKIRTGFGVRVGQLNGERIADGVERMSRVIEIRAWQIAAMRDVLTPEQQTIFDVTSNYWRDSDAKSLRVYQAKRDSLARLQSQP